MKKSFNLRLTAQKLKLQGKLHQTYSHTHLQFRVGDESRHIDVDLSKSWLVMGDTSEHRQQIIQIGLPVTLKVIKGINDHIEIELTSKRFAFSDSIVIASSRLDLTPIMEAKDKQLKIFTNLESRESKQVMAILYLEILVESIESELVSGNSLITGVANELHLLGRKNHPQLFKQLEAYNEAKKKDENIHLDYMKGTKVTDNLELAKLVEKTLPFLAALDPVVSVAFFLEDIFTLKDMTRTLLFLTASSLAIVFFELAFAMLPVALMLYILSNSYYMKRYQVSRPNIARTVPWILAQMETGIAIRPKVDRLVSDVVFWGKPQFSLVVIKGAVPASIGMFVGLRYMPLRYMAASGIWVPVLSQVEFFKVLGQAVTLQLSETDFEALICEYKNDLVGLASRFEPSELNRARIKRA